MVVSVLLGVSNGFSHNARTCSLRKLTSVKESDPPTLHCAPVVVVYERRGPQNLSFHDNASFKNSDRSKITN